MTDMARTYEAIDDFCASFKYERNASEHSVRAYRTDLLAFAEWASGENVDVLRATRKQIRAYLGYLSAADYENSSIDRHVSALRTFYRWAELAGVAEVNPAKEVTSPKKAKTLPRVLRSDEIERLLAVHGPIDASGKPREQSLRDYRDQAILEFMYATGCRISEVAGLLVADVNLADRSARVLGKGSKERIVLLHERAVEAMRAYESHARCELLQGRISGRYFISNRGLDMSADLIRKMFKETCAQAGLPADVTPHTMRHSFATDMLSGGADLRTVQELLGHAGLSTTQIYTHLDVDRILDAHAFAHPRAD